MHCIYWIHAPSHTNPYTEGYIGVTGDLRTRITSHTTALKTGTHTSIGLCEAYNEDCSILQVSILYYNDRDKCYAYEHYLRPDDNIGWNKAPGGCGNLYMYNDNLLEHVDFSIIESHKLVLLSKKRAIKVKEDVIIPPGRVKQRLGRTTHVAIRNHKRR